MQLGASKYELSTLVKDGVIEKLARGVYRLANNDTTDEDLFKAATLRVGLPSSICLISALSFYDLTDLIPKQTWIMVPYEKRSAHSDLRLYRCRRPQWKLGVNKDEGFWITTPERTIIDSLLSSKNVGVQVGIVALRLALDKNIAKLQDMIDLAAKLGVLHRLLPYFEAFT